MSEPIYFNSAEEARKAADANGWTPQGDITNPETPVESIQQSGEDEKSLIPPEQLGEYVAQKIKYFGSSGYVPTFEESKAYLQWKDKQEVSAWQEIANGAEEMMSSLWEGG